ncbi:uncharacterized protein NEMAJ01_0048 [Nematocida major]|uniref:uncharacterized protein n=1 Tax=Nematocida major TaxID=1912982 RepID=UPI002008BF1A|nr:uncharacterized protein NEMAJ01_0048 [Nematocida major]KAH9385152.1 hypothetical protein NEMAJ01_0048 [Nematocida major]
MAKNTIEKDVPSSSLASRQPFREKCRVGLLPCTLCFCCGRGQLSVGNEAVSDVKSVFMGFKYIEGVQHMVVNEQTLKSAYIYKEEALSTEYCTCDLPKSVLAPIGTLFSLENSFSQPKKIVPMPVLHLAPKFPVYSPYAISVDSIISGEDARTTCMIKNIPNKLNIRQLIELLTSICYNSFDFVYLRMDFKSNCNNGYAFINFRKPKYIPIFLDAIQGKRWKNFKSEKRGDIAYARIQGLHMLQSRFRRSDILAAGKEFWPVIFNKKGDEILASEWRLHS